MPIVSVVLCTNRVDDFFYRSVESLLKQEFDDFEVVIVLNGGVVNLLNELQSRFSAQPKVKIIVSSIAYLNHSLNLGVEHAKGRYIARMDADDVAYPQRLSTQFQYLEAHPEITVCGSWYDLIDSADTKFQQVELPVSDSEIRRALLFKNPICHPTVMLRRDVIAKAGGYLGGLYAEDYDLWLRLMVQTAVHFSNLPQALLGYRADPVGAARRSALAYASVAGAQWNAFVRSGDPRWMFAATVTCIKRWLFARK